MDDTCCCKLISVSQRQLHSGVITAGLRQKISESSKNKKSTALYSRKDST